MKKVLFATTNPAKVRGYKTKLDTLCIIKYFNNIEKNIIIISTKLNLLINLLFSNININIPF